MVNKWTNKLFLNYIFKVTAAAWLESLVDISEAVSQRSVISVVS